MICEILTKLDFWTKIGLLTQCVSSHYSKSRIFVQKLNFDKTQTISRVFQAGTKLHNC